MPGPLVFPLQPLRTDGWFERIGETIGSFQALCDIIGANFFAFAMITGARITALTVDRRNPDQTLVDFVLGGGEVEATNADAQHLTLGEFRHRLTSFLVAEEPIAPPPTRLTDTEALQLHIGVRYLLLAPLYGYGLEELTITPAGSFVKLAHDGGHATVTLEAFRARIRGHVQEELNRASQPPARSAIELARVPEAEAAIRRGDFIRVLELLGSWPAPLAIFLRTPEGQTLNPETRSVIARGLGILGSACIALEEVDKGEEVLRLAVQYAVDGPSAADIFTRLGTAMANDDRPGEAIAPLRRALKLGAEGAVVWPLLADSLMARGRHLAALGVVLEAREQGVRNESLDRIEVAATAALGPSIASFRELVP
ncbi:MAG: hypothetical protein JW751_32075 [Polyangiaceae bacterium]|nr:hypothetical protein [Polyangiaceae bacterium]